MSGHTGNAAEVSASSTGSNAAWYFAPITVFSDEDYTYSDWYQSTAASDIYVQLTTASGTLEYVAPDGSTTSAKTAFVTLPATGASFTQYQMPVTADGTHGFYVPPEVASVTVIHALQGAGSLTIDDVLLGAFGDFMTPSQVLDLQNDGQEIGGHTQTHVDLTTVTSDRATTEVSAAGRTF